MPLIFSQNSTPRRGFCWDRLLRFLLDYLVDFVVDVWFVRCVSLYAIIRISLLLVCGGGAWCGLFLIMRNRKTEQLLLLMAMRMATNWLWCVSETTGWLGIGFAVSVAFRKSRWLVLQGFSTLCVWPQKRCKMRLRNASELNSLERDNLIGLAQLIVIGRNFGITTIALGIDYGKLSNELNVVKWVEGKELRERRNWDGNSHWLSEWDLAFHFSSVLSGFRLVVKCLTVVLLPV